MKRIQDFKLAPESNEPSKVIVKLINDFRSKIESLESKFQLPFVLFQDGKSLAFYIDCHISAESVKDNLDYEASLDPDEQEDIKANRSLLPFHKLFLKMKDDAKKGRQFNDIIVEYMPNSQYREKPLKIFGGQHRSSSIEESAIGGSLRYHGFRVYFGLTVPQRNEIAQVSNANINVPIDLLDRMQEAVLGPELRNWCKKVKFLTGDFAERKNKVGVITARLARTFVVNFFAGVEKMPVGKNNLHNCFIGNEVNEIYFGWNYKERIKKLSDLGLLEAGKQFNKLHRKQMEKIKKNSELSKIAEFRTKALTPSIISAWAFSVGFLQNESEKLQKLYDLPNKTKSTDPLSAKEMSEYKHQSDQKTYRGLGTRTDKKERGKLIELFLLYSEKQETSITENLIDAAVTKYLTQSLAEESQKKLAKVR